MSRKKKTRKKPRRRKPAWATADDGRLLMMRLCDLDVSIEGTQLQSWIEEIGAELEERDLRFTPHFWVSDEWFTPGGVTGIAVPFYMAHPRLLKLERSMMLEAEGASREDCLRILRHEVGHAIDHAFRLGRRPRWKRMFGDPARPYPTSYLPKPTSRKYVQHLASWYAQAHPDEDFAETFAVWLTPRSNWRRRYQKWPALKKLEYVDELMRQIAGRKPPVRNRRVVDPLSTITRTLAEHYRRKQRLYGTNYPDFYDRDLRRLFTGAPEHHRNPSAAAFLRQIRPEVRRQIAQWTGVSQYTLDQVITEIIGRCNELSLRIAGDRDKIKTNLVIVLTMHTMNFLHSAPRRLTL